MPRLIIDVTQLVNWQGRLTGIPRVMNEYSMRFANKQDTVFVVWHAASQTFQIADKHAVDRTCEASNSTVSNVAPVSNRLKSVVARAENKSAVVRKPINLARRSLHTYRERSTSTSSADPGFVPKKDDLLFVLWGEAADSNYIQRLVDLHGQGIRLAQIAYDMIPLVVPQFSGHSTETLSRYAAAIYPLCKTVIVISEHTKIDVTAWLKDRNLTVPSIRVIRLGDDFAISKPSKPKGTQFEDAKITPHEYILCIGTIEARKNHTLLYYTYRLAESRGDTIPKLVIVGRLGWLAENIHEIISKDPVMADKIVMLENVSDSELSWLYSNCKFSIYPSFYEGWGLPIAESIARKKVCLSSNTSSMPEVAGDLIPYISPYSPESCLDAINSLLSPKNLAAAERKIEKYQPTSWDTSFTQVNAIIEDVL